jgi:hypothetical protein
MKALLDTMKPGEEGHPGISLTNIFSKRYYGGLDTRMA